MIRGYQLTIRIGGDGYLGYWFITAPDTRREAARRGIAISFQDDGGAYAAGLQKFANREYDAIVLPVSSYLQHGAAHKFPGVIVAAIAESKGADGIVGFADKFPTGNIRDLNNPELKIVYTADSPSAFLLDLTIVGFDLFHLTSTNAWRVEVGGAREVLERARRHEGDMFVLWEPELSRALQEVPELKYVWGSDKFSGYIKDVFVFHRDFVQRHEKGHHRLFRCLLHGDAQLCQRPQPAADRHGPVDTSPARGCGEHPAEDRLV